MPFIESPASEASSQREPLAHFKGSHEPALLDETIGSRFSTIVKRFPDRLAIKSGAQRLTYAALDRQSDALAVALQKLGVSAGDRVATTLGISIPHFVIIYACFKLGAVLAPLNPSYSPQQAVHAIKHVSACCYIISSHISLPYMQPQSTAPLIESILAACTKSPELADTERRTLETVVVVNNGTSTLKQTDGGLKLWDYDDLLRSNKGEDFPLQTQLQPQDTINLQFTSGTTSAPKAVELSHWNILSNAQVHGYCFNTTEEERMVCTMPLYHCGGIVAVLLSAMTYGASINLPCESFDALLTLRALKEDRATIIHGVPTMFLAWIDLLSKPEFADHNWSHLKTGLLGAAPILPSFRKTLNDRFHLHDLSNCYGMTELSPMASQTRPFDPEEQKYFTVGRPVPHQTVRIAARDNPQQTLRVGEKGEIVVAGMVMKGYWEDPERTADAICVTTDEDGKKTRWMRTGDEGVMDAEGFLKVTGRIKDMIIRGGENIYPDEIENALMQCPGVKRVSVVGLPDDRYGEVVAAFVIPDCGTHTFPTCEGDASAIDVRQHTIQADAAKATVQSSKKRKLPVEDDSPRKTRKTTTKDAPAVRSDGDAAPALNAELLRAWVRARLSRHLVPKYVFWIDELPMTPTGKIEKFNLRALGRQVLEVPKKKETLR